MNQNPFAYSEPRDEPAEPEPEQPAGIHPATAELLALAAAVRGSRWRDQLAPALNAAHDAGWDWPRTGRSASLLIFDADAEPRALTDATRNPLDRKQPAAPTAEWREARQRLEAARAER